MTFSRSKVDVKTKPILNDPKWGGTIYESGLIEAIEILRKSNSNKRPMLFFLTDGQNSGDNNKAKELVKTLYNENIKYSK